jgi:two-component system sensor histidine kinase TctE
MLPVAVWLLFLGLRRGLLPLSDLQHRISKRRSNDLSPIETTRVPHELRPLIGAFNAMMKRLEANVAAQKRFIADAAHQIRTPLTGLKMQTELALTETDPDHLRRILPMLALSTGRACHLINQLLLLARAESTSALSVFKQFVDLEALFVETASLHLGQARAKQIELEFRRPTVPVRIKGDPLMLSELLKNLLDNAIKYTPSGGRIRISLSAAESAVLEIQDSGIGIPAADRPHVFERFYRVIGTPAEGSGLGLAIVREIANHHRAEVELLDNPEGTGCRVRVVFPLALAPAANTSAPENLSGIHLSSGEPYPKQASA